MRSVNSLTRRDLLLLGLVLLVAALMRFGQSGIVEFFHDDAMLSTLAQDMAQGRSFPFTGINSSVGIPNPPTSVYVMALPFALDANPMTAILFVMALNVIGVGLLWLMAHRYIGRTVALVAGLTYAISPWAVLFSRKIWAQDFHTPFVLFGLLLGLYGFFEAPERDTERASPRFLFHGDEWAQIFTLPVLLFAFQIHFAAWALLPLYLVLLWMGRKRVTWRVLLVSGGVSVLVMLPYAIGFYQTALVNPEQVAPGSVSKLADDSRLFSLQSLEYLAYLATGQGMEIWVAPDQQTDFRARVPSVGIWWIIGGMVLLGTALLYREKLRPLALLLPVWAYLPALALIPQWAGVYPHYFIASIPALALLAGIGVTFISQVVPLHAVGRSIILVAFCGILLSQGIFWRGLLRYVDTVAIKYPGFTIPIHYLQDIENTLSDYEDVLVLNDGMAWDLHHESVVWPVMLDDTTRCVRTIVSDGYAVFPAGEFAVLKTPVIPETMLDGLYTSTMPVVFPQREGAEPYTVYHHEAAPAWQGADITPIDPVRFEDDVTLTGYHVSEGLLLLEWSLPAAQPGLNYQYSGQLLNGTGKRLAQLDTTFWQGRHWCAGDRLLTWQFADVPADEAVTLDVFLYRLGGANEPRYINANVLDSMNNPAGQRARINLPSCLQVVCVQKVFSSRGVALEPIRFFAKKRRKKLSKSYFIFLQRVQGCESLPGVWGFSGVDFMDQVEESSNKA